MGPAHDASKITVISIAKNFHETVGDSFRCICDQNIGLVIVVERLPARCDDRRENKIELVVCFVRAYAQREWMRMLPCIC